MEDSTVKTTETWFDTRAPRAGQARALTIAAECRRRLAEHRPGPLVEYVSAYGGVNNLGERERWRVAHAEALREAARQRGLPRPFRAGLAAARSLVDPLLDALPEGDGYSLYLDRRKAFDRWGVLAVLCCRSCEEGVDVYPGNRADVRRFVLEHHGCAEGIDIGAASAF